jgi:hypothetical protein
VHRAVGYLRQAFIVRYNDERLPELVTQIKKQLVQFFFIVRIQATRRFVGPMAPRIEIGII